MSHIPERVIVFYWMAGKFHKSKKLVFDHSNAIFVLLGALYTLYVIVYAFTCKFYYFFN